MKVFPADWILSARPAPWRMMAATRWQPCRTDWRELGPFCSPSQPSPNLHMMGPLALAPMTAAAAAEGDAFRQPSARPAAWLPDQ
jgi:hypothetical protein